MGSVSAAFIGIIAVITLVGNLLVVVVFVKKREWLKKVHSCLLLALAIQDVLTAICLLVLPGFVLPSDVYELPAHPTARQLYCKIIWSPYIPFVLSIVSIYTCLMLAIDRWLAVLRPMTYKRFCTSKKVIATTLTVPWIAGFAFEIGTALKVETLKNDNGSYACAMRQDDSPQNTVSVLFLVFGKGIIPVALMTIAYGKMVVRLKESSSRVLRGSGLNNGSNSPSSHNHRASYLSLKRLTRMVFAASASVIICWLPDQIYFCLYEMNVIMENRSTHDGLHILAFINTCLNPFLYSFSNKQYKNEFKKILFCVFDQKARSDLDETRSRHLEERKTMTNREQWLMASNMHNDQLSNHALAFWIWIGLRPIILARKKRIMQVLSYPLKWLHYFFNKLNLLWKNMCPHWS